MIVKRKLFSSSKDSSKEGKKKDNGEKDLLAAGGLTSAALASQLGVIPIREGTSNPELQKESEEIAKKLIKKAKKQGTNVHDTSLFDGPESSHYLNRRMVKDHRRILKKIAPKSEKWRKWVDANTIMPTFGKAGDYVYAPTDRAELLAHEIGHSTQAIKGRGGSKIGRLALKAYQPSKIVSATPVGWGLSYANGYQSGKIAKRKEEKGEKEGTFNKVRTAALPTAAAIPMLTAEADASIQGMKMLKKAGASKALRGHAGKTLALAGLTYGGATAANVGFGYLGRRNGKLAEEKKIKKEKEKEKK